MAATRSTGLPGPIPHARRRIRRRRRAVVGPARGAIGAPDAAGQWSRTGIGTNRSGWPGRRYMCNPAPNGQTEAGRPTHPGRQRGSPHEAGPDRTRSDPRGRTRSTVPGGPLRTAPADRRRRHGTGLAGPGHRAAPAGRREGAAQRVHRRPHLPGPLPGRGAARRLAEPPQHRRGLRLRRGDRPGRHGRDPGLPGHGAGRGRAALDAGRPRGPAGRRRPRSPCSGRPPSASARPTARAWCTAT